jgi:hypothetical protein
MANGLQTKKSTPCEDTQAPKPIATHLAIGNFVHCIAAGKLQRQEAKTQANPTYTRNIYEVGVNALIFASTCLKGARLASRLACRLRVGPDKGKIASTIESFRN